MKTKKKKRTPSARRAPASPMVLFSRTVMVPSGRPVVVVVWDHAGEQHFAVIETVMSIAEDLHIDLDEIEDESDLVQWERAALLFLCEHGTMCLDVLRGFCVSNWSRRVL